MYAGGGPAEGPRGDTKGAREREVYCRDLLADAVVCEPPGFARVGGACWFVVAVGAQTVWVKSLELKGPGERVRREVLRILEMIKLSRS